MSELTKIDWDAVSLLTATRTVREQFGTGLVDSKRIAETMRDVYREGMKVGAWRAKHVKSTI